MSTIITTADLATYSGNSSLDTGKADLVVAAVNAWIENATSRVWGETKQITERYDWSTLLWLNHQDIVSVDSIKMGFPGQTQETVDSSAYFFNKWGRVTMYFGWKYPRSTLNNDLLEIQYTYGVTAVPDDLKLAALAIADNYYHFADNGSKDVTAEQIGSYRLQYAGMRIAPTKDPSLVTSDAMWNIVDSYSMRRG